MYLHVFVTELSGTVRCWVAHDHAVTPRGPRLVSPDSTVASGRRDPAQRLGHYEEALATALRASEQLPMAFEMFDRIGTEAFAGRARTELRAIGERTG